MNPEEYHKELEAITRKYPQDMAFFIQHYGPFPDGESDKERKQIITALKGTFI